MSLVMSRLRTMEEPTSRFAVWARRIAVFALEVMLYIVGTAFIILVLAKERAVRIHKDAAATDELTGLLNRRGFLQGAEAMVARGAQTQEA